MVQQVTVETAHKATAIAAVASPWWLPPLQAVSEWAALVLPVAGLLWIALQAGIAIYKFKKWKG